MSNASLNGGNPALDKFFRPDRLLFSTDHWCAVVRPGQVTIGSCVLICKDAVQAIPDMSPEAFADLKRATGMLEKQLHAIFQPDRINYLALMMVDRSPHFHVIPRYERARAWEGVSYEDLDWPNPPTMKNARAFSDDQLRRLADSIRGATS